MSVVDVKMVEGIESDKFIVTIREVDSNTPSLVLSCDNTVALQDALSLLDIPLKESALALRISYDLGDDVMRFGTAGRFLFSEQSGGDQ